MKTLFVRKFPAKSAGGKNINILSHCSEWSWCSWSGGITKFIPLERLMASAAQQLVRKSSPQLQTPFLRNISGEKEEEWIPVFSWNYFWSFVLLAWRWNWNETDFSASQGDTGGIWILSFVSWKVSLHFLSPIFKQKRLNISQSDNSKCCSGFFMCTGIDKRQKK